VIIVWIGPWLGIFLVDWILRKYKYNASELQRTDPAGIYYGSAGGWNWNAVVAFFTGMVSATLCFSKAPPPVNFPFHWMTPISNHFNGADFSAFAGVLISALVYIILEKVTGYVARQNKAQLDLELTK
jgi:cytosine/uracil/thiamine/allantoin permease